MYGIYQMMYLFVDALELTIEMYTKYLTESIVINQSLKGKTCCWSLWIIKRHLSEIEQFFGQILCTYDY